jgi:citronellyl-CoA dehydrogenase
VRPSAEAHTQSPPHLRPDTPTKRSPDLKFTTEHQQISDTVIKFVQKEINPHVAEWEAAQQFPSHEVFKKLGTLGLLGLKYPEEFGGAGLDFSYSMVMAEALGECNCGGVPMAIGVQTDMATPALARFGSDALRQEFLAPTIAGDFVACLGVSEPGGGSDVAAVKTTARSDGDDYVINGTKMWITNGMKADWCCLLANTSDGPPHKNKSLIVVPMDATGITRQKIRKIGMDSSDTAQLFFDNVRVPKRNLIGQEGLGFTFQMLQFQEERLWGAAGSLRSLDRLIDQTIAYTTERKAFGKRILDNQVVHYRLAELRTEVEALRALTYRAVELYVSGKDVTRLASMAKLKSGRLSRDVADSCLQYWGGMGFTWDNPISQAYRDSRLVSIGGGADEVMLSIICKLEGTLPGKS